AIRFLLCRTASHTIVLHSLPTRRSSDLMVSREGSHERGRYLLHTGYVPTGTVVHPSMGSITAMELGSKKLDLPNFIALGNTTDRSEEHTSELQSQSNLVCRLLLEKKKT